jgi:hypothetical protein
MAVVMQGLGAYSAWFWKGSHGGHHPPEHYGSVAGVVLGLIFFALSMTQR